MSKYTFTVELEDGQAFAQLVTKLINDKIIVLNVVRDNQKKQHINGFAVRREHTKARNEEIIAKYTGDPKTNSTPKLAEEYGLSKERICQILRPVNAIGTAQGRREAAKEAIAEATVLLKTETNAAWEAKLAEAMVLVRGGQSEAQAALAVGFAKHGSFVNTLNRQCRLAGIVVSHGRFKDNSLRIARIKALVARIPGITVPQIVEILRDKDDPHLHVAWIYGKMPELRVRLKEETT